MINNNNGIGGNNNISPFADQIAALNNNFRMAVNGSGNINQTISPTPFNNYRTVFTDIGDEWNSCSEEEKRFVEQDSEYANANIVYAQQFNAFLLDQFGLQFSNSKYGASAEKVLVALRNARGRFRNSTIEDVNKMKGENAKLQQQIKELEELINASGR